jgi:isoleucyl-tRNA synthetase
MENYRLYTVAIELTQFMEKLSNWYIRLNRNRIKGEMGIEESNISLNILFNAILDLSILLSPIIPFITEEIFLNLRKVSTSDLNIQNIFTEESVHFVQIPKHDESLQNQSIEDIMNNFISTIELGRKIREIKKIPLKMPIKKIQVISFDTNFLENLQSVENYVMDELNINEIEYLSDEEKYINLKCKPNFEELFKKSRESEENEDLKEKQKLNEETQSMIKLINSLKTNDIRKLIKEKKISIGDKEITLDLVIIEKKFKEEINKEKDYASICNNDCGLRIDLSVNEEIMNKYYIREVNNVLI